MAKLSERKNKKAEARQIAGDLSKDYNYVYNPRDNTYQLVSKKTGDQYTGPLGGLDADKGLIQSDRRLKRLVGKQLSHQRFLNPETVKSTAKKEYTPKQKSSTTASDSKQFKKPTKSLIQKRQPSKTPTPEPEEIGLSQEQIDLLNRFTKSEREQSIKEARLEGTEKAKVDPNVALLQSLGIKDKVYHPGDVFSGMSPSNTYVYDDYGGTENLFKLKDKYKYAVVGEKGLQRYVDLSSMKPGLDPEFQGLPEGFQLHKYSGLSGSPAFQKEYPGKTRVTLPFKKVSSLTKDNESRIHKILTSDAPYLVSGKKIYNTSELREAIKRGEDLESLTQYGKEVPKGVSVEKAYRWGDISYFKDDEAPIKKQGGKLVKKQSGGSFNPSVLDPNDPVVFGDKTKRPTIGKMDKLNPRVSLLDKTVGDPKLAKMKTVEASDKKPGIGDRVKNYFASNTSGSFDADTRSLFEKSLDYVTPVAGAADYLVQRDALNRLGDKKVPRTYNTPAQINVRAASDIPYEILTARENDINRMRSQYKGSDPVAELVSKHMVESEKGKARQQLSADRAAFVAQEQARVDEGLTRNQMMSHQTARENADLKRQYDQADHLNTLDIMNRKADLTGQALGLLSRGVENRLNVRDMSQLKSRDIELKSIQGELALQEAIIRDADPGDPADRQAIANAQETIKSLVQKQSNILGEVQGKYTQLGRDAMFNTRKEGGKLLPRK